MDILSNPFEIQVEVFYFIKKDFGMMEFIL